ncbi:undecaprenyldiphospho-muramoylpentapeptide beta-N-acetylglucosaminyltransferase [candidate division KSB1 bacterium]|nr:undecaprenyldiphospho-muramoylpentapeptide beta-N-acetylglucosaminyltransferase [candidate division KSB1 bacterium]
MDDNIRVIFAGGGTGGHLYPALALAKEVETRFRNAEFLFIGTEHGLESKVVPASGYKIEFIEIQGIRRTMTLTNLKIPFLIVKSLFKCRRILGRFKPHLVIGTGGYVSWPMLFSAALSGYATIIQEQNSYPGVSTRFLSRYVDQVHLSFDESVKYIKDKTKVHLSGNPIRSSLNRVDRKTAAADFDLLPEVKTLLIFGGSQGAHSINMAMLNLVPDLMNLTKWQILWATGENDYAPISESCDEFRHRIRVKPYISNMESAYALTDLVVSRAGATTLAELQQCELAALLIPYPYAAAGHQETNARALVAKGAAEMVLDNELTDVNFVNTMINLMNDDGRRRLLGQQMGKLARPDAAKNIIDKALELIKYAKSS